MLEDGVQTLIVDWVVLYVLLQHSIGYVKVNVKVKVNLGEFP